MTATAQRKRNPPLRLRCAGDGPDERRAGDEAQIAEDRDGRERCASPALAPQPAGQAEQGRGREGQTPAGDDEAGQRDHRMVRGRGECEPGRSREAGKSMRPVIDGQSTFCATTRPVSIAPANKPGPSPLTAGP